jgi:cytochrome c biogenesis protein CcdA
MIPHGKRNVSGLCGLGWLWPRLRSRSPAGGQHPGLKSKSNRQVLTNGFIWRLGHTSTIFLIGLLLIVFQVNSLKAYLDYFEIFVGVMLIALGAFRLWRSYRKTEEMSTHRRDGEAYGIGLIHGQAGSGGLVLASLEITGEALGYLALFGVGSALGMSVAASILRLPLLNGKGIDLRKKVFSWLASGLCVAYGLYILLQYV